MPVEVGQVYKWGARDWEVKQVVRDGNWAARIEPVGDSSSWAWVPLGEFKGMALATASTRKDER